MPDPFEPVKRGDPIQMSARTFNGHQRAGKDYSRRKMDENQNPATPGAALPPQIYNGDSALDEFSVLGFSTVPHVDPAAVPFEASEQPVFEAAAPSPTAPFCITREPIPAGGIGEIVTHGPAVVQVLVSDASHTRAVPVAGQKGYLASAAAGGVPILTKATGTGLKWCEVLLGAPGSIFTRAVAPTPGVAGFSGTTIASDVLSVPGGTKLLIFAQGTLFTTFGSSGEVWHGVTYWDPASPPASYSLINGVETTYHPHGGANTTGVAFLAALELPSAVPLYNVAMAYFGTISAQALFRQIGYLILDQLNTS